MNGLNAVEPFVGKVYPEDTGVLFNAKFFIEGVVPVYLPTIYIFPEESKVIPLFCILVAEVNGANPRRVFDGVGGGPADAVQNPPGVV
jgi:hypothetical protein